jgi:hypothetical protein
LLKRFKFGSIVTKSFSEIAPLLEQQAIELPSWAFGNSGTRFKVFGTPGTPRTPEEKIADAAQVHKYTALSPTVALHIPWDKVDDYAALSAFAADHGVALGTINSNTFQDDAYKFGSLTHTDASIRQKAIDHHFECIDIMHATGSRDLKIWLADGSNYPGQADLRGRQDRLAESLAEIYARIGEPAPRARVQVFRAGFLPHGCSRLGHLVCPSGGARRARACVPRHGTPRARHEHRVHRHAASAPRQARVVRLQLALLRG